MAQAPGSLESELKYGNEYLAANNPLSASWRFETVVSRWPDNAEGHLRLAQSYAKLGKTKEAREHLTQAVALNPTYREEADRTRSQLDTAPSPNTSGPKPTEPTPAPRPTPVPRKPTGPTPAPARTAGGPLFLGTYVCEAGVWDVGLGRKTWNPKGNLTLAAGGKYTYMGKPGTFSYNPATGKLSFLSGYFTNGVPTTSVFSPGTSVAQLDITFHAKSGNVDWSCGCNRK